MYKKYLETPCAMSIETASIAFSQIAIEVELANDEILTEVYQDFITACLRYAKIRAEWNGLSKEEKLDTDPSRTSAHNRVIDTHNILYRYMQRINLSTAWYEILGYDEQDKMTRKRLGDFACYVILFLGLHAR